MTYKALQSTTFFKSAVLNLAQAYHVTIHFVVTKPEICIAFVLKA